MGFACVHSNRFLIRMYVRGKRNETEDMELFGGTVLLGVERGVAEGN